jgi:imidazolonepropionase-like amidohydrolase
MSKITGAKDLNTEIEERRQAVNRSQLPLLLILVLTLSACQSTSSKAHRTGGVAPFVSVKNYWIDKDGEKHLVGGLNCVLSSTTKGTAIGKKTVAGNALKFPDMAPGNYVVTVSTPSGKQLKEEFELPARRRVTVRFNLDATKSVDAVKGVAKDTAYVLVKGVTLLLEIVAVVGLVSLDTDNDKKEYKEEYKEDPAVTSSQVIAESKRIERMLRKLR